MSTCFVCKTFDFFFNGAGYMAYLCILCIFSYRYDGSIFHWISMCIYTWEQLAFILNPFIERKTTLDPAKNIETFERAGKKATSWSTANRRRKNLITVLSVSPTHLRCLTSSSQCAEQIKRKLFLCKSIYTLSGFYLIIPLQYAAIILHTDDLYFWSFETTQVRDQVDVIVIIMISQLKSFTSRWKERMQHRQMVQWKRCSGMSEQSQRIDSIKAKLFKVLKLGAIC